MGFGPVLLKPNPTSKGEENVSMFLTNAL